MQAKIDALRASLGSEVGQERITARGGRVHDFQTGSVYWSPNTGARLVTSLGLPKYRELGAEAGALGFPVGDEQWGLSGMSQMFEHGFLITTSTGDVDAAILPEATFTESSLTLSASSNLELGLTNGSITVQNLVLPQSSLSCNCVQQSQRLGICSVKISSDKKTATCRASICGGSCQFQAGDR
ncbi:MAG: hypothetical protein JOZ54_24675 [Acidobacteria bacterium]|nr:hypothetical protein [Acidobacteriota bacterium]